MMTVSYNEFHKRRFSGALPSAASGRIDPADIDFDLAVDVGFPGNCSHLKEEETDTGEKKEKGTSAKSGRGKRLRRVWFSRDMFSFKEGKSLGLRDRMKKETLFRNGFASVDAQRRRKAGRVGKKRQKGKGGLA